MPRENYRTKRIELPDGRELSCTVPVFLVYVGGRNLPDEWEDGEPEFSIDGGRSWGWDDLPPELVLAATDLFDRT
jgi:hypothetical protein